MPLCGGIRLDRVWRMLEGLARLRGTPIARIKRVGVRPQKLAAAQTMMYNVNNASDMNHAALQQTGLVGVARAGEIALADKWSWNNKRFPSRADVSFHYLPNGELSYATVLYVNCKAKGVEALRKLEHRLPATGKYLSPGHILHYLVKVADPVPKCDAASTPLFRHPGTNSAITVRETRDQVEHAASHDGESRIPDFVHPVLDVSRW